MLYTAYDVCNVNFSFWHKNTCKYYL